MCLTHPSAMTSVAHERIERAVCFAEELSIKLHLTRTTASTALCYFHTFYAHKSPDTYPPMDMAQAAVFLAAKAEETPRKLKDLVNVAHSIIHLGAPPMAFDQHYFDAKARVLCDEQLLVRVLRFDVSASLPDRYLLNYLRAVRGTPLLAHLAFCMLDDSYHIPECSQVQAPLVAAACLFGAAELLRFGSVPPPSVIEPPSGAANAVAAAAAPELPLALTQALGDLPGTGSVPLAQVISVAFGVNALAMSQIAVRLVDLYENSWPGQFRDGSGTGSSTRRDTEPCTLPGGPGTISVAGEESKIGEPHRTCGASDTG